MEEIQTIAYMRFLKQKLRTEYDTRYRLACSIQRSKCNDLAVQTISFCGPSRTSLQWRQSSFKLEVEAVELFYRDSFDII